MASWWPVTTLILIAVILTTGLACLCFGKPQHYFPILDDANPVFHEAGHPVFGLLGGTLSLYDGIGVG